MKLQVQNLGDNAVKFQFRDAANEFAEQTVEAGASALVEAGAGLCVVEMTPVSAASQESFDQWHANLQIGDGG